MEWLITLVDLLDRRMRAGLRADVSAAVIARPARSWRRSRRGVAENRAIRAARLGGFHRACFPQFLRQSLSVAARQRRGVILRRHPDIQAQTKLGAAGYVISIPASTRLLRACRCAAGRCCRAAAARRPSRPRCRHTIGLHRRSGFPRSARSGGRRRAARGAEFPKDVAAASGPRSRRREGL